MKNQLKILISFLMIISFFACNENGNNRSKSKNEKASTDFIKTFEGQINNKYPIIAKIESNSGKISGNYLYTKVGQELELKGTVSSDNEIEINEFDEKGNQTGVFKGKLVNENKLEGIWHKPNGKSEMSFYLIESNSNYEGSKKTKKKTISKKGNQIKVLYRQEEYDEKLKTNIPKLKINENFLSTADDGVRAIIGFYSARAGTDCWWNNDNPNSDFSNLNCKLTSALNLGNQCSEGHKSFLKKWFSEEKEIIEKINGCYSVPYTATSQSTYSYLNLEVAGNDITVRYKTTGANVRTESFWETEGIDKFQIIGRKIKVISREIIKEG